MEKKQFATALTQSFGEAPAKAATLDSYTIEDAFNNKWIASIGRVFATSPNGYKGVVITAPNGDTACVLLGKKSAEATALGTKPKKDWSIVVTTNAAGEQRIKLSTNSLTTYTLEDLD